MLPVCHPAAPGWRSMRRWHLRLEPKDQRDRSVRCGLSECVKSCYGCFTPAAAYALEERRRSCGLSRFPVRFRTVGAATGSGLYPAVTVAMSCVSISRRHCWAGDSVVCSIRVKIKNANRSIYFSHERHRCPIMAICAAWEICLGSRAAALLGVCFAHIGRSSTEARCCNDPRAGCAQQICKTWSHLKTSLRRCVCMDRRQSFCNARHRR